MYPAVLPALRLYLEKHKMGWGLGRGSHGGTISFSSTGHVDHPTVVGEGEESEPMALDDQRGNVDEP